MANWKGAFRTNYFKVKDEAAFRAWVTALEGVPDLFHGSGDQAGMFGLGAYGAIPNDRALTPEELAQYAAEQGEDPEEFAEGGVTYYEWKDDGIDFAAELAAHLAEGQVAVVQEVGWEKLRYLTGFAYAVDHTGKMVGRGNIDDVMSGLNTTSPTY